MQNYHKHSYYSNLYSADAIPSYEDYAKRAVELGHKVLSSAEHGWQGYYHQVYELSKKYNLKCVVGTEAYWVKDRFENDKSNKHIILLAKSNMGREAINDILSEANISGYYYRPRIDLQLLLSLPPDDVFVTSACIAFSGYDNTDNIILALHEHFGNNFMLEIQAHATEQQVKWNSHLQELSAQHNIEMIAGVDSHFIYPQDSILRDDLLASKGVHYEDEEGWFMDYPDDSTFRNRLMQQGIWKEEQVTRLMNNTDVTLDFCDYDTVRVFTKDIKLPSLYPDKTQEEKNQIYKDLINEKLTEYLKGVPQERHQEYIDGVNAEVQTYIDTGMVDYPLLDYAIVNDAIDHGCLVTSTGRGSAVGYFTNTLCGFSKVDRFTSAIKLYPERFISTTRILETKSLPDIDLNTGTPDILEESQKRLLGEDHAAPMIAFGTLKKKAAFKLYAKSQHMDFTLANQISAQISAYDDAVKHADEDDKDDIDVYDFVDKQYQSYLDQSQQYWGVISDKKKAPSAYLLYDGDIRREIGLIKCKSESTKKEYITCCIDGAVAENYKFLKNDILKVDVVLLIAKVFERIGIQPFDVNTLIKTVTNDEKVWDLYAKGYTIGLNQVEKMGSTKKCMNYKPHNVSELSAFVAAIRPGFKSMYSRYENREDFSWGIPALDNLLRTNELPVSFLFFQEQVMSVLNYAGFPMDECYGIIKAIAKKHPEKVKPLKQKFIDGFYNKLLEEGLSEEDARSNAEKVWIIVNDNCGYSFNSSHAFCMALDSLYQAWQKANYPYEFYEVLMQHYSDKGKKDKVAALKQEMRIAFGINSGQYKFGKDNRGFVADKASKSINPALKAVKGFNDVIANELYDLSQNYQFANFIDLLEKITQETSCNSRQLDILIRLGYFSNYGEINELLYKTKYFQSLFDKTKGYKKQIKLSTAKKLELDTGIINQYSEFKPSKTNADDGNFANLCTKDMLMALKYNGEPRSVSAIIRDQQEFLSYIDYKDTKANPMLVCVTNLNTTYSPTFTAYRLKDGTTCNFKVHKSYNPKNKSVTKAFNMLPFENGDILFIKKWERTVKKKPDGNGGWVPVPNSYDWWINDYDKVGN